MSQTKKQKSAQDVLDDFYGKGNIIIPVDVVGIAERHDIQVTKAMFNPPYNENVFGYIQKTGSKTKIVVNAENALNRRRFTVGHELGHYFQHDGADLKYLDLRSTKTTSEEAKANEFAADLLMPEAELRREYSKLMFPTAAQLARTFAVSEEAMRIRLKKLKLQFIGENH